MGNIELWSCFSRFFDSAVDQFQHQIMPTFSDRSFYSWNSRPLSFQIFLFDLRPSTSVSSHWICRISSWKMPEVLQIRIEDFFMPLPARSSKSSLHIKLGRTRKWRTSRMIGIQFRTMNPLWIHPPACFGCREDIQLCSCQVADESSDQQINPVYQGLADPPSMLPLVPIATCIWRCVLALGGITM